MEEMEKLCVVPSAVSEPRWAVHTCDNKCKEKGCKFFELTAVVTEEGGAAHTINLCKTFYNVRRLKQGEVGVTALKWRALDEQKALWAAFGMGHFLRWMWERFTIKKAWARSVLSGAENDRQMCGWQVGSTRRGTKWSLSLCGTAMTCSSKVCRRLRTSLGNSLGKWHAPSSVCELWIRV